MEARKMKAEVSSSFWKACAFVLVCAMQGNASAAAPVVRDGSVTISQNASSRLVTVGYALDEAPGIVTVDFRTNDVSIGEQNFAQLGGDVNRIVSVGDAKRIFWRPDKTWEGNRASNVTAVVTAWSPASPPDYMVIDLAGGVPKENVSFYVSTNALPDGGLSNPIYTTSKLVMRKIPAATVRWRMGTPSSQYIAPNCATREIPHYVTLTKDYYIGVYPVTQGQNLLAFGRNYSVFSEYPDSPRRPANNANFNAIRGSSAGAGWPNADETVARAVDNGTVIKAYRNVSGIESMDLPTDAQWEFAYRAGCSQNYYTGDNMFASNDACLAAGIGLCGGSETYAVGQYTPNAWGIYDMGGNVWEYCLDWFAKNATYSDGSEVVDPVGPTAAAVQASEGYQTRVVRGGAYNVDWSNLRAASKSSAYPNASGDVVKTHGFRLVCDADMTALAE